MASGAVDVRRYAPRFKIEVNNAEISAEATHMIGSVEITQELDTSNPSSFTNAFRFEVQDEFLGSGFRWLDDTADSIPVFRFGNHVRIAIGYASELATVCEGRIQGIEAQFNDGLAPSFSVNGADEAFLFMSTPRASCTFENLRDSEIVERIATEGRLTPRVERTATTSPTKTKVGNKSYFDFLKRLAGENGFEVRLAGRDLIFQRPKRTVAPIANLRWGHDLVSFQPRLQSEGVLTEVVVRSWDQTARRMIEGRASAGDEREKQGRTVGSRFIAETFGSFTKVITDQPVRSVAEAREKALAELEKSSAALIEGTGEIVGRTDFAPGQTVELEGLGSWFNGTYYLKKVTHSIGSGGYRTRFDAQRNAL